MRSSKNSSLNPERIALGYAVIALLWIAFSDAFVTHFNLPAALMTIKGAVFVLVTASLLYLTVRRLVQTVQLTSQERDETAELYRAVVEGSNEGICLVDESGRISFLNGRLAAMLGRPAEELQGKRLEDFIEEPFVLAQPGAHQPHTRECRLRTDSDVKPWVLMSRRPVLNDAGEVVRLVVTLLDLAERESAQKVLRRSDASPPAVLWAQGNPKESRLSNPARYGLAILSVGVALGAALLLQYFHFRSAAMPLLLFAIAISSWSGGTGPALLAVVASTISFYWHFVEPVHTIYIYWSNVPFFLIFVGFAALISWFATIRRRIEAGLQDQAALLNLTHDTVFVMDMEGVIRYWNRGAEERYGWPAERAVGKVVHDLLKTAFPRPLEEIKAELIRTGRWEGDLVHTKKDGNQVAVASRWSLQRDRRGAPFAILETNNDISERKRAEEALSRLNRQLRAISDCNQALLRATDEQTLLKEICRIAYEEAGYRAAWVGYAEHDEAKSVRPVAWAGVEEGYLATARISWDDTERGRGPTGTAIRSGKSCYIQDCATDPRFAPWRDSALQHGFRCSIGLPLKDQGHTFGCLTVYSGQTNAFTPEEARLLEELAGDLAFGIVTLRSRDAHKQAEEALRQSEAYLGEAQKLSHTGSFAFDVASDKYFYISEECFRIFGLDPQQGFPTRQAISGLIHPEDWDRVREDFDRLLREKVDTPSEFRIVLPGGAIKHIHAIRHPIVNDAGETTTIVGTAIDITERKQAEQALRESESRFRVFFDHAADAFFVVDDTEEGLIFDVNRQACESLGYTREELLGTRAPDLASDADASMVQRIREGIAGGKVHTFEIRHRRKDGTVFPIEVRVRLFELGGRRLHLASARDVSERKRAEEALRESDTRFRTFVDHAADAFFMLDFEQGNIVDVNRTACESLGYTREELIGITPLAFDVNLDRATLESIVERAAAGETLLFDRHWHRRKDGSTFPVEIHASVFWHGGRRFLLKVARDITERVRAEEQREKLRQLEADLAHTNRVSMLGELAASLAHDLSQPITGAITSADACLRWLGREPPDLERARTATMRVKNDGTRASDIINHLRAFYKKGAPPQREPVDVAEIVNEMVFLLHNEASRHAITIRTELAAELPRIVADRVQLQQVFMNLMLNAVDAMKEGGGELMIGARLNDDRMVQASVSDTGVGLPTEDPDQVFKAFFTTKPQGTGMGLAITRSIVEAHGGRLWASNNAVRGATFYFTLPADTGAMNEQSAVADGIHH